MSKDPVTVNCSAITYAQFFSTNKVLFIRVPSFHAGPTGKLPLKLTTGSGTTDFDGPVQFSDDEMDVYLSTAPAGFKEIFVDGFAITDDCGIQQTFGGTLDFKDPGTGEPWTGTCSDP